MNDIETIVEFEMNPDADLRLEQIFEFLLSNDLEKIKEDGNKPKRNSDSPR